MSDDNLLLSDQPTGYSLRRQGKLLIVHIAFEHERCAQSALEELQAGGTLMLGGGWWCALKQAEG